MWDEWVAERPPVVREICLKYPFDRLYRIKSSGDKGTIHSVSEDGTLTMNIDGTYCRVMFAKNVFGLHPEDIEECELPGPDEELGDWSAKSELNRKYVDEVLIPRMQKKVQAERN